VARWTTLLMLLVGGSLAAAQNDRINWGTDPREAVHAAQRYGRPLMVYVLASSQNRDDDLERAQKRALSDARVLQRAKNYVPLRLSRSRHRNILKDFGLPTHANMMMSFVTPDGEVLGTLGAQGVGQVDSLVQKLKLVFNTYRKKVYDGRVKPILDDADAKPADIKQALALIDEFEIDSADKDVVALLDRKRLSKVLRKQACGTLAALSTQTAVTKLLELVDAGDADATDALSKCTPPAAEMMLSKLEADAEAFNYAVYKAVTRICRIRSVKPARYFEKASERLKQSEVERVTRLVQMNAQRWRERQNETR